MSHKKTLPTYFHTVMCAFALLILTGTLAACGDSSQQGSTPSSSSSIPNVTITTKDFSFDMPDTVPAGLVDITMNNVGNEPHQANLAKLKDGVTQEQVSTALSQKHSATELDKMLSYVGGPNVVLSNQKQEVILNLSPGQYVATCAIHTADHVSHVAKGMVKFFQVTGSASQASEPTAQAQVIMKDFGFVLPSPWKAGPVWLKVVNQGPAPHAMTIVKPAPGKTVEDVMNFFENRSGSHPFEDAGGIGELSSGVSGWVKMDLKPGNYVAACYVYDPAAKKLHLRMGMVSQFTVE